VLQDKDVVVVGAGKTAHDVGVAVSKVAASTTLVARKGHWMAPQIVLGESAGLKESAVFARHIGPGLHSRSAYMTAVSLFANCLSFLISDLVIQLKAKYSS
jgi:cation diffusion facilitator CzcD-associated flavoprotein CzcO